MPEHYEQSDESVEYQRQFGPRGVRWTAYLAGAVFIGVVFAPAGALCFALLAFLADHPAQKQWRGGFIILVAVFIVTSVAGVYLLKGDTGEDAPPGGGGEVTGQVPSVPA